ncbi:hypothetical protein EDB92DRAFT_1361666 [Lactarius akahatsu]|uniref:Uncharacterized protein n=1 Tax=Lactarius akahatsu TaxID=416441 RepID=A0AAD4LBX9_9AGAM|nr:hypothetical protein EDB92DRAFT_1361666 [Lactarius akahatsu]
MATEWREDQVPSLCTCADISVFLQVCFIYFETTSYDHHLCPSHLNPRIVAPVLFPPNMTNWKSPAVVTAEYFALIKFYHAIWGALIWEFVVNIGFEYSVFTGKRKFRSSFLLYLAARWCPLFCVITILVGFDPVNRISCQAIVTFVFLFSHLSLACASALIVLRIAAIWGLNKIVISIASAAWLADAGALIHGVVVLHGTRSRDLPVGACEITNILETRTNILASFVTDLVLLALMLTGLLRWENARRKGGIWWLLYTQGLAWMIIVTVAEAPITVLILLNLNDSMNLMFQLPARWCLVPRELLDVSSLINFLLFSRYYDNWRFTRVPWTVGLCPQGRRRTYE